MTDIDDLKHGIRTEWAKLDRDVARPGLGGLKPPPKQFLAPLNECLPI